MLLTMKRLNHLVGGFLCAVFCLLLAVPAAVAVSAQDFPQTLPDETVLDSADVLSRASRNEISTRLQDLNQFHVDARLVTVRRLDYGLSLSGFGDGLLDRWAQDSKLTDRPLLIFLEETKSKQATVVAADELLEQLPESLLRSTGRTTMSQRWRSIQTGHPRRSQPHRNRAQWRRRSRASCAAGTFLNPLQCSNS
jgi:uncharacterized protein